MVVKWSAVRNQSEIETSLKMRGMSPFLFVKLVQQRRTQNHAKPAHRVRRSSGQPFTGTTRSAGVGGGWVSVSDIGRVGKKLVLRRIPHDLKPKIASDWSGVKGKKWQHGVGLAIKENIVLKVGEDGITIECIISARLPSPEGPTFD